MRFVSLVFMPLAWAFLPRARAFVRLALVHLLMHSLVFLYRHSCDVLQIWSVVICSSLACTLGVVIVNALTMCLVDLPRTICCLFAVLLAVVRLALVHLLMHSLF